MPVARPNTLTGRLGRAPALALALTLGLGLAGCGGMPSNTSLYSTKQPVVERTNFTLDVNTSPSGLPISEQQRLDGWFETMDLRYGDRIAIENPGQNPAVASAIRELAGRRLGIVGFGTLGRGVAHAARAFGMEVVTDLCEQLINGGVPAIHFYTMNQSAATLGLIAGLQSR